MQIRRPDYPTVKKRTERAQVILLLQLVMKWQLRRSFKEEEKLSRRGKLGEVK